MQLTSFIVSVLAAGLVAPAAASPIDGGLLEARAITFPCLVTLDLTCYIKIGAICSLDPLKALLGNCKKSECERISSIWDASENKCYTPEEKCVKDGKKWRRYLL
ncbi:hypothetical protein BJ878DRAFT_282350 [Calycina marina]|uniref:Uncharacterized protein n=1 Tax=Calycina marina TaxID=1763456 RepID=A0A9P7YW82_9HELO|nr:hypothetical protein BJ878DRAFT_282350 [Calycina marina]